MGLTVNIGDNVWILTSTEHSYVIGKPEYDLLKPYTYVGSEDKYPNSNHPDLILHFEGEYDMYDLTQWDAEQIVFKSIDQYLHYLFLHLHNLLLIQDSLEYKYDNIAIVGNDERYRFDDFLKQKIALSMANHPEAWV
jgi:hypothetical protein